MNQSSGVVISPVWEPRPQSTIIIVATGLDKFLVTQITLVVVIKVLFTIKLPSNVNIRSKLVTKILSLFSCQFWYRQEGVDPLCSLLTLQLLNGNINHPDEFGREAPGGGVVDEVPLLGVDLSTAGLLSQLSLRHRPGRQDEMSSRAQPSPVPHTDIRHAADKRIFVKEISADCDEQLRVGIRSGYDLSIELSCSSKF